MNDQDWLAERFEANRSHLRGVAFRMLGSVSEADDAVQEAWIRLSRTDTSEVENLRAWLTTVVGRVCLNMLRSRRTRREASLETHLPDPDREPGGGHRSRAGGPAGRFGRARAARRARLADARRTRRLRPARRLRACRSTRSRPIVGRTPTATRQLASRARRRVQGAPVPDVDLDGQWAVVDAFLAAARDGDFERLLAVLDPDVVLRSDGGIGASGPGRRWSAAREAVAEQAMSFRAFAETATRVLVNGIPGASPGRPTGARSRSWPMTVSGGRIVAIDVLADPGPARAAGPRPWSRG